ncbi:hypothetical protein JL722_5778 [Aureococcus anophagefferens]|nr:hypothetical protein JL722_5778 [Aureococcus anophagefferens]
MVKHNNEVPNQHFHKKWASSSRGPLKVITWFDQPAKKQIRRQKRAAKAAAVAPRPVARLRPVVHCPTQKHCAKVRLGRGFSLAELKAAKIPVPLAKTIGISVDSRRTNKSAESLAANVARLTEYKAKLVLFRRRAPRPRRATRRRAAAAATQCADKVLMAPAKAAAAPVEFVAVTEEMNNFKAYYALREDRNGSRRRLREKAKKAAAGGQQAPRLHGARRGRRRGAVTTP